MANFYDRGDLVRLTATWINPSGVPADPSTIYCLIYNPSTVRATHQYGVTPSAIVRDAVGGYHLDLDVEVTGQWGYRWEGTGGVQAASENLFAVNPTFKL